MNGFTLNGEKSEDYSIVMTAPPDMISAERNAEVLTIPGRNGSVIVDGGSYNNVDISYSCALVPDDGSDFRILSVRMLSFLRPTAGYQKLENTYDLDHFRMARVASAISVASIADQAGTFKISWDCKPQRFLKSGQNSVAFQSSGSITNPTAFDAQPLIEVTGSSAGTVSVNGVTVEIKSISGTIYLDCENENAYSLSAGAPKNENANIYAPYFPVLSPGDNAVQFTGGITSVKITPRWWEL